MNVQSLKNFIKMNLVYLFHVLIVGPLLVKVGSRCNCKNNRVLSKLIIFLGLGVMAYHTYIMYERNPGMVKEMSLVLSLGLVLVLMIGSVL
jgi:hypothetical protein